MKKQIDFKYFIRRELENLEELFDTADIGYAKLLQGLWAEIYALSDLKEEVKHQISLPHS